MQIRDTENPFYRQEILKNRLICSQPHNTKETEKELIVLQSTDSMCSVVTMLFAKKEYCKANQPVRQGKFGFSCYSFYSGEIGIRDLSNDISGVCTLSVTDVEAVLTSLVRKVPVYLKNGFKIQLGSLGRIRLSFSSTGCATAEEVDASTIREKRIIFTSCVEIKKEMEDASFTRLDLAENATTGPSAP